MKTLLWNIFGKVLFVSFLFMPCTNAYSQMAIVIFNAEWNSANQVSWAQELQEIKTISYVDIAKNQEAQKKHKIAVIPTIIILKDGEEVARFQADLSFKMVATKEEVQEEIDNQLMSDF
tara:strand:- start:9776 stop:10132 length:357 start_codon:yes stop_codon:yes gene_type:complete